MANLAGFDASQVPEQQEFSALPEGQYVVIATASEMKPTKSGNGQFLQFTFEVLDGPQKGEAKRDDANYAYVAAWEWLGEAGKAQLHKEALTFEEVKLTQRSYK